MSLLVYISGPITAPDIDTLDANIQRGADMAARLAKLGHGYHCPHLNSAWPGAEKIPHAQWMAQDLRILAACDCVVMLGGWHRSVGAKEEHSYAVTLGKPIIYGDDISIEDALLAITETMRVTK